MEENNDESSRDLLYTNILSDDSTSEQYLAEDMEQCQGVDNMESEMCNDTKPIKRGRDENDTDWTEVRKEKKLKEKDKIEIYISSKEVLPKQFSLAKLFKQEKIKDIIKVKYLNQYKVRIEFANEISASKLEMCKSFTDKGWRFHEAMEKNYSYGVIKDVEIDMPENDILNNIVCPSDIQLVSVHRLNRRNNGKDSTEGLWIPSEAVRLCFKGSNLPGYIYVDELRIKVDPYIFPVTQCTRCWKYGHTAKVCTSKTIICPKCGGSHANCEAQTFRCVNCSGNHMALTKVCPVFIKEKRIRELMAEFNCTYRKALIMYVPPSPLHKKEDDKIKMPQVNKYTHNITTSISSVKDPNYLNNSITQENNFADVVKFRTHATIHNEQSPKNDVELSKKSSMPQALPASDLHDLEAEYHLSDTSPPNHRNNESPKKEREVHFNELLSRLKEIIFVKDITYTSKFKMIMKCCVEWVILVLVDNISDWPMLKIIFDYFYG